MERIKESKMEITEQEGICPVCGLKDNNKNIFSYSYFSTHICGCYQNEIFIEKKCKSCGGYFTDFYKCEFICQTTDDNKTCGRLIPR